MAEWTEDDGAVYCMAYGVRLRVYWTPNRSRRGGTLKLASTDEETAVAAEKVRGWRSDAYYRRRGEVATFEKLCRSKGRAKHVAIVQCRKLAKILGRDGESLA